MSDIRPSADQFFSPKNESTLDRVLYKDFQRRIGGDLTEKQQERLKKTVRHYMSEVYAKNPQEPVQYLNKEVLQAVVPDYMSYLRRTAGPTVAGAEENGSTGVAGGPLTQDVNSRFDRLQQERQGVQATPPAAPDFRVPLDMDGPAPLSRFEEVLKQREAEAKRDAEVAASMMQRGAQGQGTELAIVPSRDTGGILSRFVDSDVEFRNGAAAAAQRDAAALAARDTQRAMARNEMVNSMGSTVPPDPRRLLLGDGPGALPPRAVGIASANPTLALPDIVRDRPALPQDVIKAQDDIIAYRENEYNLFVYSADRDWVNNNTENRYNFSVNFDPANNRPGFGFSTATNIKFKNITRIEFVKAIMPVETCDIQVQSTANSAATTNTNLTTGNVFAFPYLQVRIPELNTNGYGTNDGINNAFAAISYDAYWSADSSTGINKGYARMIPKFLKCQKVYYPTPLATLQKLSFQIQRPDGNLFCESMDTLDASGFYLSSRVNSTSNFYYNTGDPFIWIQTKSYFNRYAFGSGDRIQFKNVDFSTAFKTAAGAIATTDFINFITRPEGHLVCDIGFGATASAAAVGANTVGYANFLIIRNNFNNPATGSTSVINWGGTSDANTTFETALASTPNPISGRLINLNHQVQIIMRVITRDMDAAARLRPDNLQA